MATTRPGRIGKGSVDLRRLAIADADLERILEPKLLEVVLDRLGTALGWEVVPPGKTVRPRLVPLGVVQRLLLPALIAAAGAGPDTTILDTRPLLWENGADQLLLHLAKASVTTGEGLVDLRLVVECDQTGGAEVVLTYLTASPERPHGFVLATEERPRGPGVVVQVWSEALVAFGWRALVEMARMVAATRGVSTSDQPLVASTVVAVPDGLMVTAMGPHPVGSRIGGTR